MEVRGRTISVQNFSVGWIAINLFFFFGFSYLGWSVSIFCFLLLYLSLPSLAIVHLFFLISLWFGGSHILSSAFIYLSYVPYLAYLICLYMLLLLLLFIHRLSVSQFRRSACVARALLVSWRGLGARGRGGSFLCHFLGGASCGFLIRGRRREKGVGTGMRWGVRFKNGAAVKIQGVFGVGRDVC
jgi:hypothetical protein